MQCCEESSVQPQTCSLISGCVCVCFSYTVQYMSIRDSVCVCVKYTCVDVKGMSAVVAGHRPVVLSHSCLLLFSFALSE